MNANTQLEDHQQLARLSPRTKIVLVILLKGLYGHSRWPSELKSSRGRSLDRLELVVPDNVGVRFIDAAGTHVGFGPNSNIIPRLDHVYRTIRRINPDAIIACGSAVLECVKSIWSGPLITIPHPAHANEPTNDLLDICRTLIGEICEPGSIHNRVNIKHVNGTVEVELL